MITLDFEQPFMPSFVKKSLQKQIWYSICKIKDKLRIDTGNEGDEAPAMSIIVTPSEVLMLDHKDKVAHVLGHENQLNEDS